MVFPSSAIHEGSSRWCNVYTCLFSLSLSHSFITRNLLIETLSRDIADATMFTHQIKRKTFPIPRRDASSACFHWFIFSVHRRAKFNGFVFYVFSGARYEPELVWNGVVTAM